MCYSIRAHALIALVVSWSVGGLVVPALAQDTGGPSQAAQAYEKGKGELRGGKLAEALATFRSGLDAPETDQLETWQLLLGAALAAEKLGTGADSIEYYRRFLDASEGAEKLLPPKWRERRQVVSDAVDELQRTLNETHGYLTVSSTPEAAALFVDGKRAGVDSSAKTPFGLFLKPGTYEIRLERGGFEPMTSSVVIEAGKLKPLSTKMVEIVVEPPVAAAPAGAGSAPVAAAPVRGDEGMSTMDLSAWILIGSGSASAIGGVICTVLAGSVAGEVEDLDQEAKALGLNEDGSKSPARLAVEAKHRGKFKDFETYQLLQGVLYGLSAATVVTGVVLLLLDEGGEGNEPAASFQLAPTPGGAFGQATIRF